MKKFLAAICATALLISGCGEEKIPVPEKIPVAEVVDVDLGAVGKLKVNNGSSE